MGKKNCLERNWFFLNPNLDLDSGSNQFVVVIVQKLYKKLDEFWHMVCWWLKVELTFCRWCVGISPRNKLGMYVRFYVLFYRYDLCYGLGGSPFILLRLYFLYLLRGAIGAKVIGWERVSVRLWTTLHNWPLPSKSTTTHHLQTSYSVLIQNVYSPSIWCHLHWCLDSGSNKSRPAVHMPHCLFMVNPVHHWWFFCLIFVPTDETLQPRPVVNRPYYNLPNNGAGIERRTSFPPVSVNVDSPRFHPHAKGKNIRLDGQLRRATRKNSFCNGITFSHRPVHLYEKVCFAYVFIYLSNYLFVYLGVEWVVW